MVHGSILKFYQLQFIFPTASKYFQVLKVLFNLNWFFPTSKGFSNFSRFFPTLDGSFKLLTVISNFQHSILNLSNFEIFPTSFSNYKCSTGSLEICFGLIKFQNFLVIFCLCNHNSLMFRIEFFGFSDI